MKKIILLLVVLMTLPTVMAIPKYQDIAVEVANGTEFRPARAEAKYGFSINFTDNIDAHAISNVTLEADFDGTTTNFTSTRNATGYVFTEQILNNTEGGYWINFSYPINITTAETLFSYKWYAVNQSGHGNVTAAQEYAINKNTTVPICINITVYAIGGTQTNYSNTAIHSIEGQGNPYANCWTEAGGTCTSTAQDPSWGTTTLWRNTTSWTKGSGGALSLGIGAYSVLCNSTGNANYTNNATGATYTLTVRTSGGGSGESGAGTTIPRGPPIALPSISQVPEKAKGFLNQLVSGFTNGLIGVVNAIVRGFKGLFNILKIW